jgi:hypothetical protein
MRRGGGEIVDAEVNVPELVHQEEDDSDDESEEESDDEEIKGIIDEPAS